MVCCSSKRSFLDTGDRQKRTSRRTVPSDQLLYSSNKLEEYTMQFISSDESDGCKVPWNKGKLTGPKPPLKLKEIWAIRVQLQLAGRSRDLALFNLAIDSKLRGCDLVAIRVSDITRTGRVLSRASVVQNKTGKPVKFEITDQARDSVSCWIEKASLTGNQFLFPSRMSKSPHLSTRQYARIVKDWIAMIDLDPNVYGTHSLRRTKATLIYRKTKNLRAVQLLLGHTKLESTVRYLGIEVDDALDIAEQTEV